MTDSDKELDSRVIPEGKKAQGCALRQLLADGWWLLGVCGGCWMLRRPRTSLEDRLVQSMLKRRA